MGSDKTQGTQRDARPAHRVGAALRAGPGPVSPPASEGTGPTRCQLSEVLHLLGRNHILSILGSFRQGGPKRFVELQRELRLSPNTLSARLRDLVDAGLLTRTTFNEIPPRVDYEPTAKALELFSIFDALGTWASRHDLRPEIRPPLPR